MNITIEVTVAQVMWTDQNFNPINTIDGNLMGSGIDPMDYIILSLDLIIGKVQVSNAGVYTCYTILNDTLGVVATIERQFSQTVESKSLFITTNMIF